MDYLVIFFLAIFAFIALAPGAVTQAALALVWLSGVLFIVGELLWMLGRFLLPLL